MTLTKTKLTAAQSARKAELETIIKQGAQTFREVGIALEEMRDSGLYLDEFKTFGEYCREKWDLGRSRAYQLIEAANIAQRVSTIVDIESEGAARALGGLSPSKQIKVAERVSKKLCKTPGKKATARIIEAEVVREQPRPRGGLAAVVSEAKAAGVIKERVQVKCHHCRGAGYVWEDQE